MSKQTILGIIGGTGLYEIDGLATVTQQEVATPFGFPSSPITVGELEGAKLLFLARHGVGHKIAPSEINSRANIHALKQLGAEWVVSISAVGSLQEEFAPGDLALPDQILDRTKGRPSTFFGDGIVTHVPFADPFCPVLRDCISKAAAEALSGEGKFHVGGTYVCIEGPQFSTRAESLSYRALGASLIGMTALPEAKLAREAELAYAVLALVTDYDCWRSHESDVDVPEILRIMAENAQKAKAIIRRLVPLLESVRPSAMAAGALQNAILTAPDQWPKETAARLELLLRRFAE